MFYSSNLYYHTNFFISLNSNHCVNFYFCNLDHVHGLNVFN